MYFSFSSFFGFCDSETLRFYSYLKNIMRDSGYIVSDSFYKCFYTKIQLK